MARFQHLPPAQPRKTPARFGAGVFRISCWMLAAGPARATELVAAAIAALAGVAASGSGVRPGRGRRLRAPARLRRSGRDDIAIRETLHRFRHGVELGDRLASEHDAQRTFDLANFIALLASAKSVSDAARAGA